METFQVPVGAGVALAVDAWRPGPEAARRDGPPFLLVHGLA